MTPANKGFECYVDADFAGNWDSDEAMDDADTARSRSGFVITYADCPIVMVIQAKNRKSLSTTEAEYIALSTAMRDCIPMLALMNEMRQKQYPIIYTQPNIYVKVYEDNNGALEMARLPKIQARTKHINVKYHHFRHHVARGEILVECIHSDDQRADIFTKPTAPALFLKHRKRCWRSAQDREGVCIFHEHRHVHGWMIHRTHRPTILHLPTPAYHIYMNILHVNNDKAITR
jgi:hypothetical protein